MLRRRTGTEHRLSKLRGRGEAGCGVSECVGPCMAMPTSVMSVWGVGVEVKVNMTVFFVLAGL